MTLGQIHAVTELSICLCLKHGVHLSTLTIALSCLHFSRSHHQCDHRHQCACFCHRLCAHCHSLHPGGWSLFCGLHGCCSALLYFHRPGKWGHSQTFSPSSSPFFSSSFLLSLCSFLSFSLATFLPFCYFSFFPSSFPSSLFPPSPLLPHSLLPVTSFFYFLLL